MRGEELGGTVSRLLELALEKGAVDLWRIHPIIG